jgi:hypothetical protein
LAEKRMDTGIHRRVLDIYREAMAHHGNTADAFDAALAFVLAAHPELSRDNARRQVASMIATEPEMLVADSGC